MKRNLKDEPKGHADAKGRASSHAARAQQGGDKSGVDGALIRMIIEKMLFGEIEYGYETAAGGWEKREGDVPAITLNITGAECKLLGERRNAVQEERLRSTLNLATRALSGYFANAGCGAATRIMLAQPDHANETYRRYGAYDDIVLQITPIKRPRAAEANTAKYAVYVAFPHAVDLPAMQANWRAHHHQFTSQLPQLLQMQAVEKAAGAGVLGRG